MFLAALVASHALAYAQPQYPVEDPCCCEPRIEQPREEVRLNDSFFYSGGGIGMTYSAPVYGGGGMVIISGGRSSAGAGAGAGASASASASVSASISANISVRYGGGGGGCGGGGCGGGGKPHGGGYGGKH